MQRFRAVDNLEDLPSTLEAVTRELDFDWYSYVRLGRLNPRRNADLVATNLPESLILHPQCLGLAWDDPARLMASRSSAGFRWSELDRIVRREEERRHLESARSNGLSEAYAVPAHLPGESSALITFIVRSGRHLPEDSLPMAQLAGMYAYDAVRRLQSDPGSARSIRLTKRQAECVLLVARGKTDWEIARILGIGSDTVSEYVDAARSRYGVAKRTQLVIRAFADGYFTLEDAD